MPDALDLAQICRHEARHVCCTAILLGPEYLEAVSVRGDGSGSTELRRLPSGPEAMAADLVLTLAGAAPERGESFAEPRELGCVGDEIHARALAARLAETTGRDEWRIIEEAEDRARQIVEAHRGTIECLAASIAINGGRLVGDDLQDALEAAFEGEAWQAAEPVDDDQAAVVPPAFLAGPARSRVSALAGGPEWPANIVIPPAGSLRFRGPRFSKVEGWVIYASARNFWRTAMASLAGPSDQGLSIAAVRAAVRAELRAAPHA